MIIYVYINISWRNRRLKPTEGEVQQTQESSSHVIEQNLKSEAAAISEFRVKRWVSNIEISAEVTCSVWGTCRWLLRVSVLSTRSLTWNQSDCPGHYALRLS